MNCMQPKRNFWQTTNKLTVKVETFIENSIIINSRKLVD